MEKLTHDIIEAWHLLTPTIIFQEELPSFCTIQIMEIGKLSN